jgi:hypothetical protein
VENPDEAAFVAEARIDLAVPSRSLVAEDRSAAGFRDRTGSDPQSVLGPWRAGTTVARAVTNGR